MVTRSALQRALVLLLISGLLTPSGSGQATELRGSWSALAGGRTYGGAWTARAHPDPLAAWGTWEALNEAGEVVAAGTWSASKVSMAWRGSWKARAGEGGIIAGAWSARVPAPPASPFLEMLCAATTAPVSGAFTAGNATGSWTIRASPR